MSTFSRKDYDNRRVPELVFTRNFTIEGCLFMKGDDYPIYRYGYWRLRDYLINNIITEPKESV